MSGPRFDPGDIWPEDLLSEDEWEAGWFDRQVIAGRLQEADRASHPRWLGGTADR